MLNKCLKYEFTAKPWLHAGPAGWHFISLPMKYAQQIRRALRSEEQGWGRLKATARIGTTEWQTAIWFDTKLKTYLLPLKAEIRKKEGLEPGKEVKTVIWV